MPNRGFGNGRMLDLGRGRFDFLPRRRRLHFGSLFRSGLRLMTGRRCWRRLGRGDFSRGPLSSEVGFGVAAIAGS